MGLPFPWAQQNSGRRIFFPNSSFHLDENNPGSRADSGLAKLFTPSYPRPSKKLHQVVKLADEVHVLPQFTFNGRPVQRSAT